MADTVTTNYSFVKPDIGSHVDSWGPIANNNYDMIDDEIKERETDAATAQLTATNALTIANAALPKAGGTMTGPIVLSGDPTAVLNPATKQYTDAQDALKSDKGLIDGITTYSTFTADAASFALTDLGALVKIDNVAVNVIMTIPLQAIIAWPINARFDIVRMGTGEVAITIPITPTVGTIKSVGGKKRLNAQYSGVSLIRLGADDWLLTGDLKV